MYAIFEKFVEFIISMQLEIKLIKWNNSKSFLPDKATQWQCNLYISN